MQIIGRKRTKSRNRVKNRPREPINMLISTHVGWNMPHAEGMKSRERVEAMITKRSYHITAFGNCTMIHTQTRWVRKYLNQKSCGATTLQNIMHRYAHQCGPVARYRNAARS